FRQAQSCGLAGQAEHEIKPDDQNRQGEKLPHREAADQEAEERIRFTEQLNDAPRDRIAREEEPHDKARLLRKAGFPENEQQDEQQRAFERGLIKLARVARLAAAARKHHRPRHIADAAVKLGIDEIRNTSEEKSNRDDGCEQIAKVEDGDFLEPAIEDRRDYDAEKPAMEGHATLPDHEYLGRVGEVIAGLVKEHVTEAAAEKHAKGCPDEKI